MVKKAAGAPLRTALPHGAQSPGIARHELHDWLGAQGCASLSEVAVVIASELVTNAVVHGDAPIRLAARRANGCVRVEVFDSSPTLARRRDRDVTRPGGWGLELVETLATDWGSNRVAGGKVTWASVDATDAT